MVIMVTREQLNIRRELMKNENKLLFYDLGNVYIGKDKLEEDVFLEGGGDWDFTLSTITTNKTRKEFDDILMCHYDYYYKIIDPQPQNWIDVCKLISVHFATTEYVYAKTKIGKQKLEISTYDHDATGFEAYLPFNELHDWHIINDDGNFRKITCEWKNDIPHIYVLFAFATS